MVLDAVVADICRTRTITAEAQSVWDVLADFGKLSSWADNVDHSCVLTASHDGGPIGMTRRVQIGRNTLIERVIVFEPLHSLAYDIEGLPRQLRKVCNRWVLEPTVDRSTVVTLASTIEIGPRSLQRLAERVLVRVLAKQTGLMLAGLANRLERSGV